MVLLKSLTRLAEGKERWQGWVREKHALQELLKIASQPLPPQLCCRLEVGAGLTLASLGLGLSLRA